VLVLLVSVPAGCDGQTSPAFAEAAYCRDAQAYLAEDLGLPTRVDPDTIQDWRTRQTLPGCRLYASGPTDVGIHAEAPLFYERLMAAGWVRTPDPQDMPNEAAIRVRKADHDCLFHVYTGPLLGTPSEIAVSNEVIRRPDQERYNLLVQCLPAMEAAPT
jgi:hypothetical protein